jgi:hypothetical protein
MNRRSILTKTGKGLMEATGKTSNLARDLRNILKEIDGKVSVSQLLEKFDKLTEQKLVESLSSMERDGYVREFIGKQDDGPRTPAGRASGPPTLGEGSDLDFTAFTPAKPNAKATEEARLQAQAQEIARQAQATRAREEAAAKARADAVVAARAKADAEQRAKQAAVTKTGAHTPLPPLINPTVVPPVAPPVVGILGAGPEAQARAQAEAQARSQAEALEKARRDAEEKARRDAEEKAKRDAEEKLRRDAEEKLKREAEERRLREIAERTRREQEEKAKVEAAARAKREAEERAKREAEDRIRRELEERTRREVAERLRREEEERRRREEEERARREAERQARIEAETKARVEAELRAKREAEERVRREDEEGRQSEKRRRAEEEQRSRLEAEQAEALERTLREEQEKAQREAAGERIEPVGEERGQEEEEGARQEQEQAEQQQVEEEKQAREAERRARKEEKEAARAAAKTRKAERARERAGEEAWRGDEDALRDSGRGSLSAREIWQKRRPRSFLKTLAMMLVLLAIVGVAVLPLVPFETAAYEKSAQAWLGLPVKIGSVNLTLLPLPQLKFQKVVIGRDPQLRAAVIKATPEPETLLDDRATLKSLALENVTVPKEFLAVLLQDKPGRKGLGVRQITATGLKIDAPELGLPALDLEASFSPDGALKSATFSNGGQLSVKVEPRGGRAAVEISAAALPLPVGVDFGLSDFSAKGTASPGELALANAEGRAFGGRIFGTLRLRWSSGWNLDGDLSARQMDADKVAGPLVGAGTLQGRGKLSMKGLLPERMVLNSQLDGSFTIQKGSVSNVDMTRLLQGSGSGGGMTPFSEMSGDFSADPNRLLVRNIRLAAGLLSGQGQLEMDPQRNLSGRMQIELRAQSVQARSTLNVTGTLTNPQFRRSN